MNTTRDHWQSVYQTKSDQQTSWFRPHLDESLRLIDGLAPDKSLPVIDVGGGRSTLADDLLTRAFGNVTVLDLSPAALEESRRRLDARASSITWLASDILEAPLPSAYYALWHDRAVFHFLTDDDQRARYAAMAARCVRAGGFVVLATFAPDGPEKCSGLPVRRHDARGLAEAFSGNFSVVADSRELHPTPFGTQQPFTYVVLRRNSIAAPLAQATE